MTKTRTIITAAALIIAAGQLGCSRSDDSQAAVREAGRQFETVAVGNANSSNEIASKAYLQAESLTSEYAGSEDGYAEAAALSVAQSKIGQASIASKIASQKETGAIHRERIIRGHINEWLTMSAIAQAAGTFDATDDLKELSGLITMRQEDIVNYRTLHDEIMGDIADLESKIAGLEADAQRERNAGAEIELRIPDVSATQGAELAERVREHTLRGDQYGLEAVRIQGRVEQLRPTAEEFSLNVNKARSQIELLEKAREELQERERSSKADAAEARSKAQTARESIIRLANELDAYRADEVDSANAKAITLARGAITATRDAKNSTASVAALTKASASQLLAECLGRKAHGHNEAATIFRAIAEANVPGNWSERIEREREEQESAKQESLQAYQDAASTLRRSRVRGEAADKLEAAAVRLDALGGVEAEAEYSDEIDEEYMDDADETENDPIESEEDED